MRVRNVIQSRMSSTRLPGKALLPIHKLPMAALCAKRAANTGIETVIATSTNPEDDVLSDTALAAGFEVIRGNLNNVLSRFLQATSDLDDDDVVVRLTADNIFPDGELLARLTAVISEEIPYARIGGPEIPYGLSAEAFRVSTLRSYPAKELLEPNNREHVTPWIRSHFGDYLLEIPECSRWAPNLRCTIDSPSDYLNMTRIFDLVEDPVHISWQSLCDLLDSNSKNSSVRSALGTLSSCGPSNEGAITPVLLGSVQLGVPYGINSHGQVPTQQESQQILAAAERLKFAGIDTARAYGESEKRIGEARSLGIANELHITTKVRPLDFLRADTTQAEGLSAVTESVAESLSELDVSRVSAILTHRAQDWYKPGVKKALVQEQQDSKAEHIGVSLSKPDELFEILKDPVCTYIQLPLNILDHRWNDKGLQALILARPDVTIVARSVLLQGLLVEATGSRWPSNVPTSHSEVMASLDLIVGEFNRESRLDLCLAYVNGIEWVTSMVLGCESANQAEELSRLSRQAPLTPLQISEVHDRLPKIDETLLDPSLWK